MVRLAHHAHAGNLAHLRESYGKSFRNHREVGKHPALPIMLQAIELALVHDQQMARIFNNEMSFSLDGDGIPSGGKKPLAIPAVEILVCADPDCAICVGNDILGLKLCNSLIRTVPLET